MKSIHLKTVGSIIQANLSLHYLSFWGKVFLGGEGFKTLFTYRAHLHLEDDAAFHLQGDSNHPKSSSLFLRLYRHCGGWGRGFLKVSRLTLSCEL